jgi:hypothetical protein
MNTDFGVGIHAGTAVENRHIPSVLSVNESLGATNHVSAAFCWNLVNIINSDGRTWSDGAGCDIQSAWLQR